MTTLATLLLELSLTRIFSVVFYYHFAFLAISIALFGLGAGGVFSYVVGGWRGDLFGKLGRMSALNSLLVILALAVALFAQREPNNAALALIYICSALPFIVSGAIVSLAISASIQRVDRVYFFDLLGAAGGCAVFVPLLDHLGGPNTALAVAVLFAAAASIWHSLAGSTMGRAGSVGLALLLVAFMVANGKTGLLDLRYAKGQKLPRETFVRWNSFSRVALGLEKDSGLPMIFIDADASTGIPHFDFARLSEKDRRDLLYQGPGLPYSLRPGAKALIIGPGGGWDVARALASGSRDITGVEINPIIATTIMRQRFPQLSGDLYRRPEVRIAVEDGRSFVARSEERYQVLQATLVDTWASTAAGAFALSESNLYTVEAFQAYLEHLTDDGLAAFTRWGFDPPRESLRIVSLALEALRRLGESQPAMHFIVARAGSAADLAGWGTQDTVLISRKPFAVEDVRRARDAIAKSGMHAAYLPGERIQSQFTELLLSDRPEDYQRRYRFDISPVGDNRPFFFYTVQPRDVWGFVTGASRKSADYKINRAIPLLFGLMAISVVATIIVLALPPLALGARLPRDKGVLRFLLYFLCIGAGYILVEVSLIQKFVLFLGHPTYALTVIIFSMLVASSLGSYSSRRLPGWSSRAPLLAATVIVGLTGVTYLLPTAIGWPFWLKIAATVLAIFPAGFLMGMPFPSGLAYLEAEHPSAVRWAWSLNAAASVLGSVGAIVCAICFGLTQTLLAGGVFYVLARLALPKTTLEGGERSTWPRQPARNASPPSAWEGSSLTCSFAPSGSCTRPGAWMTAKSL